MQRFDSTELLKERAVLFRDHFGPGTAAPGGTIEFREYDGSCILGYRSRNSLMSRSYFLSLTGKTVSPGVTGTRESCCYLNRLGSWKFRGRDRVLKDLCSRIKKNGVITEQLRKTDVESVSLKSVRGEISLHIDLYGGGFTSVVLPPMKFPIGIPEDQISRSARLFKLLQREINRAS